VQGGYTSFEAFWIGGLSAPAGVIVVPPPQEPVILSGGPFAEQHTRSVHWEPLKKSEIEKQELDLQILREDGEIMAVIIALCH
jgi:hypothetical protein